MTTANSSTPHDVVTAALLVIGDEILSGRTKDKNIGYIAEYLTAVGIDLMEVRVVGDEEASIVDALNALRHRYTYVFHHRWDRPDPRRHHRRLRRQGVWGVDRRRSARARNHAGAAASRPAPR
jgi:hypothetical protein